MITSLVNWWANTSNTEILWLAVGFGAQMMFSMRFLIQWIASEKARASIVPETFWYFSFVGGAMLLVYAIYRVDPVFIMGQATGLLIYSRNIYFIQKNKSTS
ncbi:MAG: lipid-A-disaccharide synthase N-terminal domain-containing protein [Rhizobiaceae bacterium]|nr:lipid-A-disaccharide synthase N-terminal domain-containing protein [Rhizobiaceae bacterium]